MKLSMACWSQRMGHKLSLTDLLAGFAAMEPAIIVEEVLP